MSTMSKIALVKEMIDSAEANLRSAKQILHEIVGGSPSGSTRATYTRAASGLSAGVTSTGKIIEGVFDGQHMIGSDKRTYPVPANYASKSKLVPGDVLKLTITDDGSFLYKQIGPIERKRVIGPLTIEDGQPKIITNGKAYKVLLASVTYFRAEPGDQVTLIIPALEDSEWGAIENVIPKISAELQAEEAILSEASGTAHIISENFGSELDDEETAPAKKTRKKKEE